MRWIGTLILWVLPAVALAADVPPATEHRDSGTAMAIGITLLIAVGVASLMSSKRSHRD